MTPASWTGPVSNAAVAITFRQHIGANVALRTGTYAKTLTFTLSTTTPVTGTTSRPLHAAGSSAGQQRHAGAQIGDQARPAHRRPGSRACTRLQRRDDLVDLGQQPVKPMLQALQRARLASSPRRAARRAAHRSGGQRRARVDALRSTVVRPQRRDQRVDLPRDVSSGASDRRSRAGSTRAPRSPPPSAAAIAGDTWPTAARTRGARRAPRRPQRARPRPAPRARRRTSCADEREPARRRRRAASHVAPA